MEIQDLMYNEIVVNDVETARMLDLLLARLFGHGTHLCVRVRKSATVSFKFWSTEKEYNDIIDTMEKELNHWDTEYKELLELS